jgi:uncharacterized protein (DUF58 family)
VTDELDGDVPYLDYHVRWRSGESRPGKHAARQAGTGGSFHAYRPFWQLPDARNIDVRRSITDPAGEVVVRHMNQRSSILVVVAADVSRSMMSPAAGSHTDSVIRLAQASARSATRGGDAFGFLAFDERIIDTLSVLPTHSRSSGATFQSALGAFQPRGRNSAGMLDIAAWLPPRRCLLLLASDFLMPLDIIDKALATLARHDVAPVVFGGQDAPLPAGVGLLRMRDVETGASRLMLLRPALHRRWRLAAETRRRALHAVFERYGRTPFYAGAALNIAHLSQHLLAG